MDAPSANVARCARTLRVLAQRLLTIGENRIVLLAIEMQEQREHLVHTLIAALCVAAFGLLALIALSAALVLLLWNWSPIGALLVLAVIHGTIAIGLTWRMLHTLHDWQSFTATLDQLRKDRAGLEAALA